MSGATHLTDLDVSGNTTLNNLHVKGNTTMSGNLTVQGNTFLNGNVTISGSLSLPNGAFRATKQAPNAADNSTNGYGFAQDGDTGLFAVGGNAFAGSDLVLYNDNQPRLTVSNGGNIGIGTSTPTQKLDIVGDVGIEGWIRSRGNTGWYNQTWGG